MQLLFKIKKHAFNRMKRTRRPSNIIAFKRLRSQARKTVLLAKRDGWRRFCNSITNNTKLTIVWQALKKFSSCNYSFYMPALKHNGDIAETEYQKANMLADQFHSVSSSSNHSQNFLSNRDNLSSALIHRLRGHSAAVLCKDQRINLPIPKTEFVNSNFFSKITSPGGDRLCYEMF